jgi:hypothetical protein
VEAVLSSETLVSIHHNNPESHKFCLNRHENLKSCIISIHFLFHILLISLIESPDICQEGIFRRSGKMTRQQELKSLLNQGIPLNLDDSHFSVHDCASVLKNFLSELPESLLTDAHYPAYCQIAGK